MRYVTKDLAKLLFETNLTYLSWREILPPPQADFSCTSLYVARFLIFRLLTASIFADVFKGGIEDLRLPWDEQNKCHLWTN